MKGPPTDAVGLLFPKTLFLFKDVIRFNIQSEMFDAYVFTQRGGVSSIKI